MLYRESMGSILVSVNGVALPTDSWATFSGGDAVASSNKTRPGGMGVQQELGGQVTRTDATITRQWSDALIATFFALDNAAGHTNASVTFIPLNSDKTTTGQTGFVYNGVLLTVTQPPINSDADAASFLSIVIGLHEPIGQTQH